MPETTTLPVVGQREIAAGHFELILSRDERLGEPAPGQFISVACRDHRSFDPLLRRPFSFYRVDRESFSIVYRVVGRGTEILSRLRPGGAVDCLGPLGNGFDISFLGSSDRVVLVGGGVGVPPIFHLSQVLARRGVPFIVCVGFASRRVLFGVADWVAMGVRPLVATDDGSAGHRGPVTDLLRGALSGAVQVYACGPHPMLAAVSAIAREAGVGVQVAMEAWMGCGVGACLSCVHPVEGESGVRWARICREGPVLDGSKVVWSYGR